MKNYGENLHENLVQLDPNKIFAENNPANTAENAEIPRAVLSIDGDMACALLGENLQDGEAEFAEVDRSEGRNNSASYIYERRAAFVALNKLRKRLGIQITYALGQGLGS